MQGPFVSTVFGQEHSHALAAGEDGVRRRQAGEQNRPRAEFAGNARRERVAFGGVVGHHDVGVRTQEEQLLPVCRPERIEAAACRDLPLAAWTRKGTHIHLGSTGRLGGRVGQPPPIGREGRVVLRSRGGEEQLRFTGLGMLRIAEVQRDGGDVAASVATQGYSQPAAVRRKRIWPDLIRAIQQLLRLAAPVGPHPPKCVWCAIHNMLAIRRPA